MDDPFANDLGNVGLPDDFGELLRSTGRSAQLAAAATTVPTTTTRFQVEAPRSVPDESLSYTLGTTAGARGLLTQPSPSRTDEMPRNLTDESHWLQSPITAAAPASAPLQQGGFSAFASLANSHSVSSGGGPAAVAAPAPRAGRRASTAATAATTPLDEAYSRATPPLAPQPQAMEALSAAALNAPHRQQTTNPSFPTAGTAASSTTGSIAAATRRIAGGGGRTGSIRSARSTAATSYTQPDAGPPSWLGGSDAPYAEDPLHGEEAAMEGGDALGDRSRSPSEADSAAVSEDGNETDPLLAAMGLSQRPTDVVANATNHYNLAGSARASSRAASAAVSEAGTTRSAKTQGRDLRALEAELLRELENVDAELMAQKSALHSREVDAAEQDSKRAAQIRDAENGIASTKDANAEREEKSRLYVQESTARISRETEVEVAEVRLKHRLAEERRHQTILESAGAECEVLRAEVARIEQERELLKKNGAFSEKGIYVAVEDRPTLEGKLHLAVELVTRFISESKSYFTTHVRELVRSGTREVADEIWAEKAVAVREDCALRRSELDAHRQKTTEALVSFATQRGEHREQSRKNFHRQLQETVETLRQSAAERAAAAIKEAQQSSNAVCDEFRQRFETSMEHAREKAERIIADDTTIEQAQFAEVSARLDMGVMIHKKLLQSHKEELETHLERETRLLERGSTAAAGAFDDPVASMRDDIGDLQTKLSQLTSDIERLTADQRRFAELAHCSAGTAALGATGTIGSSTTSEAARRAAATSAMTREREALIADLKRSLMQKVEELQDLTQRGSALRELAGEKLEQLAAQMHDARLQIESESARSSMVQLQWEKEHRAMLSGGIKLHPSSSLLCTASGNGGHPDSRLGTGGAEAAHIFEDARHHPYIAGILEVALALQEKFGGMLETVVQQRKRRGVLLQARSAADETLSDHFSSFATTSNNLFSKLLSMNSQLTAISEQQVAGVAEKAKLDVEKEILSYDQLSLLKRGEDLKRRANELQVEGDAVMKESEIFRRELNAAVAEKTTLETEKERLVMHERDMHRKEAAIRDESRRLDHIAFRMQQKKLVSQLAGGSSAAAALVEHEFSVNGGASPNSMANKSAVSSSWFRSRRPFDPASFLGPDLLTVSPTSSGAFATGTDHSASESSTALPPRGAGGQRTRPYSTSESAAYGADRSRN